MEYKDYYKILGVERAADDKAIKTAYRKLARKYHPDVSKGSATKFQEVNEAYEVLSDPEKRRRYDTLGPDWQRFAARRARGPRGRRRGCASRPAAISGGFSDFFQSIFGNFRPGGGPQGGGPRARGRVRDFRRDGLGTSTSAISATWADRARRSRAATRRARSSCRSRKRSRACARPSRSSWTRPARPAAAPATSTASPARDLPRHRLGQGPAPTWRSRFPPAWIPARGSGGRRRTRARGREQVRSLPARDGEAP